MAKADLRDFYTDEATSYENVRYGSRYGCLFRTIHREAVEEILATRLPWPRALDVASGTGQLLPPLLASSTSLVACDLTPAMLKVSRTKYVAHEQLEFCVADAGCLPYREATFDVVASARFLHLFDVSRQGALVAEMGRVLCPGGILIVDFYSATSRRIFQPAIWMYRKLLRKRPENDHRVDVPTAMQMLADAGLTVSEVRGVGNFLLVPLLWLPQRWLVALARGLSRRMPALSEQFIVVATRA